jgi:pyruvate dehydrogenase E2 component (dihydrolipoamide acetyltransferase)
VGGNGFQSFTPIINAPEVAILGVSRAAHEPVFENGAFSPKLRLPLALSYDHRLIDGADTARFMRWYVQAIENPWTLFIDA